MKTQPRLPSPEMTQALDLAAKLVRTYKTETEDRQAPTSSLRTLNKPAESYRHGQAVARILASWQADPALQAAGLLHSFVWQEMVTPERIAASCGERVAFLTQEYRNILQQAPEGRWRGKPNILKRVKLYQTAYRDPALVFIGVASLWDRFILAGQSEPSQQRLFADEAEEILIPLLDMLGLWELKEIVDEWAMQHGRNREDYNYLNKRLAQTEEIRCRVFDLVKDMLEPKLPSVQLKRRKRTPVQIYNPQLPEKAHPEALQKLTVDLIVATEEACYAALRWIHNLWQPIEHSLLDYIGTSKLNGYQCLQAAVIVSLGASQIRVDFHIRTRDMDEVNRWGLAALELRQRQQMELPRAWWHHRSETYARICSAPIGSLPRTLYVFSPQGQLFGFHQGCTVVDYAYQVHSEVAHQCKRFKVNGEVVSPITPLRHLDLVELERDPRFSGPTRAWLSAAHTDRARSHIQRFLKRQNQGWLAGQSVLEHQLRTLEEHYHLDIPEHRVKRALNQAVQQFNFERLEDLLADIAVGRFSSERILHPLFSEEITRQVQLSNGLRLYPHQLSLAQCCKPRPGDNIVGRSRSRAGEVVSLKIHQADCPRIANTSDSIPLNWRLQPQLQAVARLEATGLDEDGLLGQALQVIYAHSPDVTLHQVDAVARNGIAHLCFTIEAKDQTLIDKIIYNLANLSSRTIDEVRQMQLLFSEREELIGPMTPAAFNPYRRLPVREREMFFGRTEELVQISDWLRAGTGLIFVRGQKRVGKTSLLLHLKQYYLDHSSVIPVFIDFQMLGHLSDRNLFYELASTVYNDLRADDRLDDVGPPLLELFETAPAAQLADYLRGVQRHFGFNKLVLLIDEFSRTIDAYQQRRLADDFFHHWRGIVQATTPEVSFILVVQQRTYDNLIEQMRQLTLDPSWHLLEMGETIILKPLSEKDARQLIERPTYNHLEYSPDLLNYVWRLTGGSPFLIQAFCFNLVRHMARSSRRRVEWEDVRSVEAEFMHPHDHLFTHLIDVIRGIAHPICRQLARFATSTGQPVPVTELRVALPRVPGELLLSTLHELAEQHILIQPEPGMWQFASLLFGRWLALNSSLERHEPTD